MSEKISHWAWVGMKYRPVIKRRSIIRRDTERLAEELCEACGYTLEQISTRTRKREIVNVRKQVIYAMKKLDYSATHKVLGELFGGLDHTTITHYLISAKKHIDTEPEYKERVNMLLDW